MASARRGGRIITFYSYKGGTGRSMSLANLAWVLAANRRRVLMVDWDLEAPGLHRYFHPFLSDKELTASRGLIDLLADYADQAIQSPAEGEGSNWYAPLTDLAPYLLGINFNGFPEGGRIDLLSAGRQGSAYASKLQAFDWDTFYERLGGGAFLEALKDAWRERYDYILIDSRTGVSDTAGICTVQMPDILVAIFTYNNQSLRGALAVARSAVDTRRRLYGQFSRETFRVFPVPSRADPFEVRKLQLRQTYARRLFTPLLDHLPEAEHNAYWTAVEVPYNAFLNYEEVLSPLIFNPDDPKLPLCSVLRLAAMVSDGEVSRYDLPLSPEARQQLLLAYENVDDDASAPACPTPNHEEAADSIVRSADALLGQFDANEVKLAARLLLRLIRLPRGQEAAGLKRLLVPLDDLAAEERPLLDRFVQAGILRLAQAQGGTTTVEIADEIVLGRWRQLNAWADAEREFLEQRYWLQASWEQWQRAGRPDSLLLAAPLAEQASRLLASHAELLSHDEIDFIERSRAAAAAQASVATSPAAPARRGIPAWVAVVGSVLIVAVALAFFLGDARRPQASAPDYGATPPPVVAAASPAASASAAATGFYIAGEQSLAAGRFDEAIDNFSTALKLRADSADALFKRGEAYRQKKERDKAIADLEAGLRLQGDRAEARLALAQLLAEKADKPAAIREYQAALGLTLDSDQRRIAAQALEKLNPAPDQPRIYMHINNRADLAFAERLVADLETLGAQSNGVQVLAQSTNADVRYANVADERIARQVRDRVQAGLDQAGFKVPVQLIYIGNTFPNVDRGHIEVWLPPLAPQGKPGASRKAY